MLDLLHTFLCMPLCFQYRHVLSISSLSFPTHVLLGTPPSTPPTNGTVNATQMPTPTTGLCCNSVCEFVPHASRYYLLDTGNLKSGDKAFVKK